MVCYYLFLRFDHFPLPIHHSSLLCQRARWWHETNGDSWELSLDLRKRVISVVITKGAGCAHWRRSGMDSHGLRESDGCVCFAFRRWGYGCRAELQRGFHMGWKWDGGMVALPQNVIHVIDTSSCANDSSLTAMSDLIFGTHRHPSSTRAFLCTLTVT